MNLDPDLDAAVTAFDRWLKDQDNDELCSQVIRNYTSLIEEVRSLRARLQPKPRKKNGGIMEITALKVLNAPEWERRVREALAEKTMQAAAKKLNVSATTIKRFKAEIEKIDGAASAGNHDKTVEK